GYSDTSTFRQELKKLAAKGELTGDTMAYAAATRPLEELYDTQVDPFQLHNLAHGDEHRTVLETMRCELRRWQLETRDAGFYTEAQWWNLIKDKDNPWDIAHDEKRYPLERLLEVAGTVGRSDQATRQREWLKDDNDGVRYWAAIGLHARKHLEETEREALRQALNDSSMTVRIESAAALCAHGDAGIALPVLTTALHNDSLDVVLHAARVLELLGTIAKDAYPHMKARLELARKEEASSKSNHLSMFIRFSLDAALTP
ncbi:MAG: Choline-sulfatase, partial [Verrucomicrobiota bacterium]